MSVWHGRNSLSRVYDCLTFWMYGAIFIGDIRDLRVSPSNMTTKTTNRVPIH